VLALGVVGEEIARDAHLVVLNVELLAQEPGEEDEHLWVGIHELQGVARFHHAPTRLQTHARLRASPRSP
jgi:hypothetical protein